MASVEHRYVSWFAILEESVTMRAETSIYNFDFYMELILNLFLFISINLFTYIGLYYNKIIMYLLFQNNIIGNVLQLALGTKEISLFSKELSYPIKILILFVFICNDSH